MIQSARRIIDRHETSSGEIQLQQRQLEDGTEVFEMIVDGVFLMASYNQLSERALVHAGLAAMSPTRIPMVRALIGGLGMGFTVQEALASQVAQVDVVEISPQIVEWNRRYFAALNGNVLDDTRVRLIQGDLYELLYATLPSHYDLILLDVDNGPSWLAHERNRRLYSTAALTQWSSLLSPDGVLVVWSAQEEPKFLQRLRRLFAQVEEVPITVEMRHGTAVKHYLYRASARP